MSIRSKLALTAALGIALLPDMPVDRRGIPSTTPNPLKTGSRKALRNKRKAERKAKRKSK